VLSVKLAVGHHETLRLTLNRTGHGLLERYHKLTARLELIGVEHGKTAVLAFRTITFKLTRQKTAHRPSSDSPPVQPIARNSMR
jgi:hypothetical protein